MNWWRNELFCVLEGILVKEFRYLISCGLQRIVFLRLYAVHTTNLPYKNILFCTYLSIKIDSLSKHVVIKNFKEFGVNSIKKNYICYVNVTQDP